MASTRQTTPGPSNASQIALRSRNTNKRALSDADEDFGRDAKRIKQENGDDAKRDRRDKKRRRKKKKRETPVVAVISQSVRSLPHTRRADMLKENDISTPAFIGVEDSSQSRHLVENIEGVETNLASNLVAEPSAGDKGKARATPEFHAEPQPSCSESSADTIIRLKEQLENKTQLVKKHEELLTQLQQSVTCQICMDLMFKPYALTPCGHLACYACLVQWFTVPQTEDLVQPVHLRQKTCPHCRAVIKDPPVAVWGVKSIAVGLSKSGLLPGANMALIPVRKGGQNVTANEDENGQMPTDPWSKIFPRINHHQGPWNAAPHDLGLHDVEDGGIFRCVDCLHEIWDGLCSACGRVYGGHEDLEGGDEGDWDDIYLGRYIPWLPVNYPPYPGHFEDFYEQDEDVDEDGYESSFIDDEDDRHMPAFNPVLLVPERATAAFLSDSDDDMAELHARIEEVGSDDPGDDVDVLGHEEEDESGHDSWRGRRGLHAGSAPLRTRPIVLSDDEESDGSAYEDRPILAGVRRRRVVSSDDEDSSVNEDLEPESGDGDSQIDTEDSASEEHDRLSENEHMAHFRYAFPERRVRTASRRR